MHDEALKQLWQQQRFDAPPRFSGEEQIAAMKRKMKKFDRTIFWRDSRESLAAIFVIAWFGVMFFKVPALMPRIGCAIIVLAGAFVCWYPISRKRRVAKTAPDAPVAETLRCELQKVEVQIRLLRSVLWWYLLPLGVGVLVFYFGLQPSRSSKLGFSVFVAALYGFIYWLNQHAVKKQLLPLKHEIEASLPFDKPMAQAGPEKKNILPKTIAVIALCLGFAAMLLFGQRKEPARAPAFGDVSAFENSDTAHVDAWLQEQVAVAQYPSLSVAIVRDGKIAYLGAFGFEDIKARRRATPQTAYHVASVTKAFTASMAVMLHARGVVDLDQPVARYLPNNVLISTKPKLGATITLRQLASHTSGLPRGAPGAVQSVEGRYELEPQRLYEHLARVSLESDPGTAELYSNLGFGLLGHVLERATGKPFDRLLQEMLCEPLQLERTAIRVNDKLRLATGYSSTKPRHEEKHSYRERFASSGGLIATPEDLTKFLAAQMKPGLFSSEMLEQLHTTSRLSDGAMARTALGWSIRSNDTVGRILEKNGGRNNGSAWIGFAPKYGLGVAVVANCGDADVDAIGRWLLERSVPGGHKPVTKYGSAPQTR
jgi:CubicO group peptidase (beta-lactamase class C family)